MIVLDTNVISELMRRAPEPAVCAWIGRQKILNLAVTTVTLAEIHRGLKRLPAGKRRDGLERRFLDFLSRGFDGGRIRAFDRSAAEIYGDLCRLREREGRHADPVDMMIAAVARTADAAIATRNTGDFEGCGLRLIDPWHAKR